MKYIGIEINCFYPSACALATNLLVDLGIAQNDVTGLRHLRAYSGFSIFEMNQMQITLQFSDFIN